MEPIRDNRNRLVAEVLGDLRKNLQRQIAHDLHESYEDFLQPVFTPPPPSKIALIEEELRQNLLQASYHYHTASWVPDHRFFFGRPLMKKLIFRALSFYTDRQTQFNATVVRALNGLQEKLTFAFQRDHHREQEIRELRAIVEELRATVERLSAEKGMED